MVLHDVDVGVAPGLRGAVSWSPTPPSIGHVIATVVWVRAVLIPEGGGHKSQTQKEPELPLQNMDKGTRRGTRRIWSLTQGIKGTKERWVCGMTEARKQPAFSRSRPQGPEVRKVMAPHQSLRMRFCGGLSSCRGGEKRSLRFLS